MSWWLENPLPIVLLGTTTVILLGAIWLQSGQKVMLYAMLAAIAFVVTALIVERSVETAGEQVHKTLFDVAGDVERNDIPAAMQHVHPTLAKMRQRAETEMQRWNFDDISIKHNLQIQTFTKEQPPRAVAEFNVMVTASNRSGTMQRQRGLQFARVTFHKDGDNWLVSDYEYDRPDVAFKRRQE